MASCRCPFRFPAPRGAHSVTVDYCQAPTSNKSGHGSATGLQHKRNEGRQTARKGNGLRTEANARYRRAVRARGHFPNDAAALKCLYLVTRSLEPTGRGRARWVTRWKPALNAFAIAFEGRIN